MTVSFVPNSNGIREALSTRECFDETYRIASGIASRANSMVESQMGVSLYLPAYSPHRGEGSDVGISNVATNTKFGRIDNSLHHTLQKAGGI